MPKASDAYPKRNLPGSAEDWGRRVEGVQKDLDDRLLNLEQSVGIHASTLYGQSLINQVTAGQVNDNSGTIEITTAEPQFPGNISVTSNVGYWLDDGTAKSVVIISFDPVTKDISNRDINIEKYELWSSIGGAEKTFTVSSVGTTISYDGWIPGVEVKFALRAKSIYGIASGLSQDVTVTPADPANIVPKAPVNLVEDSNTGSFAANNAAIATINVSWDAVTESTDDDPITVPEYEVWINGAPFVRTVTNSIQFTAPSESVNLVRVRAKSIVNAWGDLSADPGLSVTAASPSVATRAPSDPTLTTAMGIVTVAWDGTYVSGGTSGAGSVFIEKEDGVDWIVQGAAFGSAGSFPIQSVNGETVNVRLAAYDLLGRLTGRSGEVDIVTEGVDTVDITTAFEDWILAQAGGATITVSETEPTGAALGDLWFKSSVEGTIENIYIYNGTAFVLHSLIADSILVANSVTAKTLNANEIFADSATLNSLKAGAVSVGILTTDLIQGTGDLTLIAGTANDAHDTATTALGNAGAAADAAQVAADAAGAAQDTANTAKDRITETRTRFIVTSTGARVQSADATQSVNIEPTGISIVQNGVSVSTWTGAKFSVDNMTVTQKAEIGGHVMEKFSTGRTTFKALT